jgi:hypothetical protein
MHTAVIILAATAASCCLAQQPLPVVLPEISTEERRICPAAQAINDTKAAIRSVLRDIVVPQFDGRSAVYQPPCACGGSGGWTRIADLNMTDPGQSCPTNWNLISTPVRGCARTTDGGCDSAIFPSNGQSYSRVCGKVIAYQQGSSDAFEGELDGVSLTHGPAASREHIWSFVAALYDTGSEVTFICPCTNPIFGLHFGEGPPDSFKQLLL